MILLTGATGFTGRHVLEQLLEQNIAVRCFIRETSDKTIFEGKKCEVFIGDIHDHNSWNKALNGISGVINIISFKEQHIKMLIEAMEKAKVSRGVFISTTAIFTKLNAKSKHMRLEAEKLISSSNLNWCVLRPTMIYGTSGDRNIYRLIKAVKAFPLHPILGTGDKLIQPIYVKDLATAIINAYFSDKAQKTAYNLSGKKAITYKDAVLIIADLLRKKIIFITIPLNISLAIVTLCKYIPFMPKITREQVLRLNEDKAFSYNEAARDFGFSPLTFQEGVLEEIEFFLRKKDIL